MANKRKLYHNHIVAELNDDSTSSMSLIRWYISLIPKETEEKRPWQDKEAQTRRRTDTLYVLAGCGLPCLWPWQSSNALFSQQLLINVLGLHSSTGHVYVSRSSAGISNEKINPCMPLYGSKAMVYPSRGVCGLKHIAKHNISHWWNIYGVYLVCPLW